MSSYVKNKGLLCKAQGCHQNAVCKGFCTKHYQQLKLRGKLLEKDYVFIQGFCKILGCGRKVFAKDLCQTHYKKTKGNSHAD